MLVITYAYIGISILRHKRSENNLRQKIDVVLKGKYPSAELVTGVGIYQVLKYHRDDIERGYPVLIRGVVKMGIDLKELRVDYQPGQVIIYYPGVRMISIEVLNLVDVSGKWIETDFYNDVHAKKRLYLREEAMRKGLAQKAERSLQNEIRYFTSELAPDSLVVLKSKESLRGKVEEL